MNIPVLKLVATPILAGLASSAGRRWGQGVGGWLVGLPSTAGPVVYFLAVDRGPEFATSAALGSLAGGLAQSAFCLRYSWTARHLSWLPALAAGSVAFGSVAALMHHANFRAVPLFFGLVSGLGATLHLIPSTAPGNRPARTRRWDILVRMVTATVVVVSLTGAATVLGPILSGILATFQVYAGTLATFGHHLEGCQSAVHVLRGLIYGLSGFAIFFLMLAILMGRTSIAVAFLAAAVTHVIAQAIALCAMRRAGAM